eukprot:912315-Pyramimonas_sp.AAC.1
MCANVVGDCNLLIVRGASTRTPRLSSCARRAFFLSSNTGLVPSHARNQSGCRSTEYSRPVCVPSESPSKRFRIALIWLLWRPAGTLLVQAAFADLFWAWGRVFCRILRLGYVDAAPRAARRRARHSVGPCSARAPDYLLRSALGGVRMCSVLSSSIVAIGDARAFQRSLSELL